MTPKEKIVLEAKAKILKAMALVNLTSIYTSKRWNLDTTIGRKIFIIN